MWSLLIRSSFSEKLTLEFRIVMCVSEVLLRSLTDCVSLMYRLMKALMPPSLKDVRKKWTIESHSWDFYKHWKNLPLRL